MAAEAQAADLTRRRAERLDASQDLRRAMAIFGRTLLEDLQDATLYDDQGNVVPEGEPGGRTRLQRMPLSERLKLIGQVAAALKVAGGEERLDMGEATDRQAVSLEEYMALLPPEYVKLVKAELANALRVTRGGGSEAALPGRPIAPRGRRQR
jgi:hypothetical protein